MKKSILIEKFILIGSFILIILFSVGITKVLALIISEGVSEVEISPAKQYHINTNTFSGITINDCQKIKIEYEDCDWDKNNNKINDEE